MRVHPTFLDLATPLNLKSAALPVPEIIAIEVLGGGCEPPILGKGRPYGVGYGTIQKSVVEFL